MSIKLGDKGRCKITGFEGAVTAISVLANNCDRIQLTLMNNPEKIGEAHWFDTCQVDALEETSGIAVIPTVEHSFKLGDKVKDKLSIFTGVVMQIAVWANGCVRLGVQSSEMKDGLPVDELYIPVQQAELVEKTKTREVTPTKTGGPCRTPKMMR